MYDTAFQLLNTQTEAVGYKLRLARPSTRNFRYGIGEGRCGGCSPLSGVVDELWLAARMHVFESVLDEVSKQNQNVKRQMQAKNNGELQPTGRSKLSTHADNLALGNTNPPEQQAYTTTLQPREVIGPPMEVVARPTLTPRDQTLNYSGNELAASFSRASCSNILQFSSLWLAHR